MFRITAYLDTPVCLGKTYLTLDAVLYGILSEIRDLRGIDTDPVGDIPLMHVDGLFRASRAYFDNPVHYGGVKTGGIRLAKDLADAPLFLQPSRGRYYKVSTVKGPMKAHLSRYRCIGAESVSWIAEGDASRVQSLLESAGAIGARRKDGHGALRRIEVEPAKGLSPLIDEMGEVRRPIPVRLSGFAKPTTGLLTAVDTWRPPYWDAFGADECYIPRPA
ncbi:hypothetical protein [uncultured Paracoccus sp.]|uniref:hypothetical protein n=1 Tax=uncultured Paracoccus sp. TaxID=189685 RepID=UPI0025F65FC6|nr:hypothetical protein [uncultured Paracoccus sp.]